MARVPLHKWNPTVAHHRCRDAVAKAFGLPASAMVSRAKRRDVVRARQAGYWVVHKRFPALSFPRLGKIFGWRDHSTVIYGLLRAEDQRRRDPEFRRVTDALIAGRAVGEPAKPLPASPSMLRAASAAARKEPDAWFGPSTTDRRNDFESGATAIDRAGWNAVRRGSAALLAALQREGFVLSSGIQAPADASASSATGAAAPTRGRACEPLVADRGNP